MRKSALLRGGAGVASIVALLYSGSLLVAQDGSARQVEWRLYAGDSAATKFSPLTDINRENVQRLRVAWQWQHGDKRREDFNTIPGGFQNTPLMLDGVLYVTTPYNNAVALDAETGKELWQHESGAYMDGQIPGSGFHHRSGALWFDGNKPRFFLNTRNKVLSLDTKTGQPVDGFGEGKNGVSLIFGYPRPMNPLHINQSSPPVVYKDLVIVGSSIPDRYQLKADPVGTVQAFNTHTGTRAWVFNTIPQSPSAFGADTWENESWRVNGHANVWAPMSLDEQRGLLYIPTSTPGNDYYGGRRHGANLFAESLVCLDAATGQRKWHFQTVHHGLWDYDNPAAPNLITITVDGQRIDAVAMVTKQGFTFVFDRVTGKPVWPIEERPVLTDSDVPGEKVYATQPFPTKPPPFAAQGVTLEDANDLTPEIRALAQEAMKEYRLGPLFTPPSLRGTLMRPANVGGANWGGAAWDQSTGYLIVRASHMPYLIQLGRNDQSDQYLDAQYDYSGNAVSRGSARTSVAGSPGQPPGRSARSVLGPIPLTRGPYGTLTALDLNKGEIAWRVPLGEGSPAIRNHPLLKGVTLPERLGSDGAAGPVATAGGLVFVAGGDSYLYAFDKANGKELWRGQLPYARTGTPMTYRTRSGRQFVVIATGAGAENALVAFALDGK
jgi:quinoprotein glucose dehydrogenase